MPKSTESDLTAPILECWECHRMLAGMNTQRGLVWPIHTSFEQDSEHRCKLAGQCVTHPEEEHQHQSFGNQLREEWTRTGKLRTILD